MIKILFERSVNILQRYFDAKECEGRSLEDPYTYLEGFKELFNANSAFPEKNRKHPIEDIDFSSFRTPWISNSKKGNPLDIRAIDFELTPGYPSIKRYTPGYPQYFCSDTPGYLQCM